MTCLYQLHHLCSCLELITKLTPLGKTLLDREVSLGLERFSPILLAMYSINQHCFVVVLQSVTAQCVNFMIGLSINAMMVFEYLFIS